MESKPKDAKSIILASAVKFYKTKSTIVDRVQPRPFETIYFYGIYKDDSNKIHHFITD